MFCPNCKSIIPDNTAFCPNCGVRLTPPQQPVRQAQVYPQSGAVLQGIPMPGFSARVNDPAILAAVKKNRKASGVFAFFLVPLPLVGFIIYSFVSEDTELTQALMIGGIVSAIFLVFALFGFVKGRAQNTYEAVVTDKKAHTAYRGSGSERTHVTEYVTVVKTTDGKTKRIREQEGSQIWAYNYFNVGDRFRYHPQFAFPYEHYDKSRAPYIGCVACGTKNPVEADCCAKCGTPLLK